MIGQKGLPATHGGIEHHVEQIGRRLVERGHDVTVFSRRGYAGDAAVRTYQGMRVRTMPTIPTKRLDALVHSGVSTVAALAGGFDILHYHALGPGIFAVAPKVVSRAPIVLTVHGLDHQRGKWGPGSQALLSAAHWMSGHVPDQTVVVSRDLRAHYLATFGRSTTYIANGVEQPVPQSSEVVTRFGVAPGDYLLFVGRLVPEKGVDLMLCAYQDVTGDLPLVVVGDSSFTDDYIVKLRQLASEDRRVRLVGGVFGGDLAALYQHSRAFIQPSVLEGLPLTLLEALSHRLPIVASDIPPHVEVLQAPAPGRWIFRNGDRAELTRAMAAAALVQPADRRAAAIFADELLPEYDWEYATSALEQVYLDAAPSRRRHAGVHSKRSATPAAPVPDSSTRLPDRVASGA